MANPAELLLEIFESWNTSKAPVKSARDDNAEMSQHRLALRLLDQIDMQISVLEAKGKRVRYHKHYFPQWVQTVFNYPRDWNSQQVHSTIDARQLQQLESLANDLDDAVPRADPQLLGQLSEYLVDLLEGLDEDKSLDETVKTYARSVVTHLQDVIANLDKVGELELELELERLIGTLLRVTAASNDPGKWRAKFSSFVWPFAKDAAISLTTTGILALLGA